MNQAEGPGDRQADRRAFLAGVALAAMGLAGAGCTQEGQQTQTQRPASPPPAAPMPVVAPPVAPAAPTAPAAGPKAAIAKRVVAIIAEQLGVEKEKIVPKASFQDDLGADSLDLVELVMAIEEEFDITIPDEDAEKLLTVGQTIDYVARCKAAQALKKR